jgi:hypothetical protein
LTTSLLLALSDDSMLMLNRLCAATLAERKFVSPIDVARGLGWLHPSNVERWRRGHPAVLEDVVFIEPARIAAAIGLPEAWACERGLQPSEHPYPAASRTPRELRFSTSGDPGLDQATRRTGSRLISARRSAPG